MFPRLTEDSIGPGKPAYSESASGWVPMHKVSNKFSIFNISGEIYPRNVA